MTDPTKTAVSNAIIVYDKGDYVKGAVQLKSQPVPKGNDYFKLIVDRTAFDTKSNIRVDAEVSYDAGVSWTFLCGLTCGGPFEPINSIEDTTTASIGVSLLALKDVGVLARIIFEPLETVNTSIALATESRGFTEQPADIPHSAVFDATSSVDFVLVSSASWTHTPSGTPTGLGVGVSVVDTSGAATITSVTYNSISATLEVDKTSNIGGLNGRAAIYRLANPSAGAQTVAVTFPTSTYVGGAGAVTVTGGDTTTVFSNNTSASGSTSPLTVTCTSASDELVMDTGVYNQFPGTVTATVGGGQTQRWNRTSSNTWALGSTKAGAASVAMSWTLQNDRAWAQVAASFKASATAAAFVSTLLMMGV